MIRVAVIHQHPAVRAGLDTLFAREPDLVVVGEARQQEEIQPLLYRTRPDVVLIGEPCGFVDALAACRMIKAHPPAPRVLVYADAPSPAFLAASALAEVDGVVDQAASEADLLTTLRAVAAGEVVRPGFAPGAQRALGAVLAREDLPILAMRLAATPPAEVAATLGLEPLALRRHTDAMIASLRHHGVDAGVPLHAP